MWVFMKKEAIMQPRNEFQVNHHYTQKHMPANIILPEFFLFSWKFGRVRVFASDQSFGDGIALTEPFWTDSDS